MQAEAYMKERLAQELKGVTHKPHINKAPENLHRDHVYTTPWQRLNKSMTQQTKVNYHLLVLAIYPSNLHSNFDNS